MKKYKNKILSVLLLSFSILIIHDYVIVDPDSNYETSYVKVDQIEVNSSQKKVDSKSLVHSQIHLSMDMPLVETIYIIAPLHAKKIFDYQIGNISYIHPVLQRPPLT